MIWDFIPDTHDLHAVKFKKGNINRAGPRTIYVIVIKDLQNFGQK